jgi:hypothetical protein
MIKKKLDSRLKPAERTISVFFLRRGGGSLDQHTANPRGF